jgi:hypothetical protein
MRRSVVAALVLAACLGAAGQAQAVTRYAVPGGTAGDAMCLSPAAGCSLNEVLENVIATGDEVVVTPGNYDLGTQGVYMKSGPTSVNVHGEDGQPRPTIFSTPTIGGTTFATCPNTSCAGDGKVLRHLRIENRGNGSALYFVGGTPADPLVVDDVVAIGGASNASAAIFAVAMPPAISAASIRNTTAYAPSPAPNTNAIISELSLTLRNVTAVAPAANGVGMIQTGNCEPGDCSANATSTVVNSILSGGLADVRTTVSAIGCGTGCVGNLAIDYSNFDQIANCTGCTTSAPGSAHNQTAAPLLVDFAGGDFHQLAGSPTVDAGVDDPANGTADLDGNPRTLGAATDIGAYEDGHPRAVTAAAANVSQTGATLMGSVDPVGFATTYFFEWGPTDAYGNRVPATDASAGSATTPQPVSADLGGLTAGMTVHYRLVATNAFGTVSGGDRSFTTLVPAPPALSISGFALTNRRFRVGGRATPVTARKRAPVGTTFRYTLSQVATVTITLQRARPGRRVGKACRAPAPSNRGHRRCTRYAGAGKLTRSSQGPGAVSTAFSGRVAKRKLKPGRYRAAIRGTGAAGSAGAGPVSFSVVR